MAIVFDENGKYVDEKGIVKLDPTIYKDWQIAEAAEANLRKASDLAKELDLRDDEWTPYGDVLAKIDVTKVLKRVGEGRRGKYIDVTAITPTALGEGKTTTTIGLADGLKLGDTDQILIVEHTARGIGGGVEHDGFGFGRHIVFQRRHIVHIVVLFPDGHLHSLCHFQQIFIRSRQRLLHRL